jgi:hypothetical protein
MKYLLAVLSLLFASMGLANAQQYHPPYNNTGNIPDKFNPYWNVRVGQAEYNVATPAQATWVQSFQEKYDTKALCMLDWPDAQLCKPEGTKGVAFDYIGPIYYWKAGWTMPMMQINPGQFIDAVNGSRFYQVHWTHREPVSHARTLVSGHTLIPAHSEWIVVHYAPTDIQQ